MFFTDSRLRLLFYASVFDDVVVYSLAVVAEIHFLSLSLIERCGVVMGGVERPKMFLKL